MKPETENLIRSLQHSDIATIVAGYAVNQKNQDEILRFLIKLCDLISDPKPIKEHEKGVASGRIR
jgi:hypothetical protein